MIPRQVSILFSLQNGHLVRPTAIHLVLTLFRAMDAELQRMVRGVSAPSSEGSGVEEVAQRAGVGYLLAGAAGAAIGAASVPSRNKWFELPTPIITSKRLVSGPAEPAAQRALAEAAARRAGG
jgi:hypothetical protein